MANVFQAAAGNYRDPMQAMTLKALEARAKAAQDATQKSMDMTPVANPFQGIAGMLGTLGAGLQQGRVENAMASGRQDLADAIAHMDPDNPDMGSIARIGVHDPEMAQHFYDQAMQKRMELQREKFQAGESSLERQQRQSLQDQADKLKVSEDALQRGSTESIAAKGQEGETGRTLLTIGSQQEQERMREKAASELSTQQAGQASSLETQKGGLAIEQEAQKARDAADLEKLKVNLTPSSPVGKILQDFSNGRYTMPGEDNNHPNTIKRVNDAIAAENARNVNFQPESRYTLGSADDAVKRHGQILRDADASKNFAGNVRNLINIGAGIDTGPEAGIKLALGPAARLFGVDISNMDKMQAYAALADKMAPNMRVQGAGASSDFDAKQFLNSLPKISNLPGANRIIESTLLANDRVNQAAAALVRRGQLPVGNPQRLEWQQIDEELGKLKNPFEEFNAAMDEVKAIEARGGIVTQFGQGDTGQDPNDPLDYYKNKKGGM